MQKSATPRGRVLNRLRTTLKAAATAGEDNSTSTSVDDGDDDDLAFVPKVDAGEMRLYSYFGGSRVNATLSAHVTNSQKPRVWKLESIPLMWSKTSLHHTAQPDQRTNSS